MTARGSPMVIAAAPNGAYKTRADHKTLPITAAQLAATAARVCTAGARMLHLHVRDSNGKHTLCVTRYAAAIAAIRARVADELFIQVTSEAAGKYSAARQREAIYALGELQDAQAADGVSIAIRELIRAPADAAPAQKLLHHIRGRLIPQYILYDKTDVMQYQTLRQTGVIPAAGHSVLFVLGRDAAAADGGQTLRKMARMFTAVDACESPACAWMACGFGAAEFAVLTEATRHGGHMRVGFENNLRRRDGKLAEDNAELVADAVRYARDNGRAPANRAQTRMILGAIGDPR